MNLLFPFALSLSPSSFLFDASTLGRAFFDLLEPNNFYCMQSIYKKLHYYINNYNIKQKTGMNMLFQNFSPTVIPVFWVSAHSPPIQLVAFPVPPRWDASPSQGYPHNKFINTHLQQSFSGLKCHQAECHNNRERTTCMICIGIENPS